VRQSNMQAGKEFHNQWSTRKLCYRKDDRV